MYLSIPVGTTSKIIQLPIFDSSSTTGAMLTGLVWNAAGLTGYYNREGAAGAATAITLATATKGTWATGGFIAVDGTNMPGWYELHIPDAALASGAKSVSIHLKGATNMVPVPIIIELTATSNQDAVRGGMTALPNANAEAAGGLYTRGTGAGQIAQDANGNVRVNLDTIKTQAVTAAAGVTFPTSIASPTNITAATGIVLSGVTHTGAVIPTVTSVTADVGITQAAADKVWSSATRTLTAFSTALALSVWDVLETAILTASSIGLKVKTNLDATVSSRSSHAAADVWAVGTRTLTSFGTLIADTWSYATRILTAGTNIVLAKGTGVTGFNDLSAAQVNTEVDTAIADARLDELLAADSDIDGLTPPTVGSVFHELMTKTAASFTYDQTTDSLEALRDRGDAAWITATGFSTHTAADVWAVATRALTDKADFALSSASRAAIVDEVWDEDVDTTHQTAGSAGKKLDDAGGAADPWSTALPGGYGAGTAGNILGNRLVGTIATGTHNPQSGDAYATVNALNNISIADVKNQVDAALDTAGIELTAIPTTTGTLRQKINFLFQYFRNKKTVTATTETLFKEDAATTLGTATVSDDGTTFTKGEAS